MISEVPIEKNPNESLADLVVAKLREKGFVPDGKTEEIEAPIPS